VNPRVRLLIFLPAAAVAAGLLVWAFTGLPGFGRYPGPYGDVINRKGVHQRHATNVVNTVVFDYRGFDTLGEEFILFAAVMGVTLLLRVQREEEEHTPEDQAAQRAASITSDAVRAGAMAMIVPTAVLGTYVVIHGHLTPGGGFQGGVVLFAAPLFLYIAGRYVDFRRLNPMPLLDLAEGSGAAGFALIGLGSLALGAAFLGNVIGKGGVGSVYSGGDLPVLNLVVGLEVGAGLLMIASEFMEQTFMVCSAVPRGFEPNRGEGAR
jgi:multicomponent Na+:H+ antiporter subunit B